MATEMYGVKVLEGATAVGLACLICQLGSQGAGALGLRGAVIPVVTGHQATSLPHTHTPAQHGGALECTADSFYYVHLVHLPVWQDNTALRWCMSMAEVQCCMFEPQLCIATGALGCIRYVAIENVCT